MSEKSLEGTYKEYLNKSGEMYSTHGEKSFIAGFVTAQKDLQQKLDTYIQLAETKGKELERAIEVIKEWEDLDFSIACENEIVGLVEKSQKFLKKLEKWK